ncbi:hypothetical protein NtRootA9_01320 [Arthrobacter sp. NtRootA9]|nr:hypothetical protein NtRootA9_01320 [Arthrobacter sp. NtRootA9]
MTQEDTPESLALEAAAEQGTDVVVETATTPTEQTVAHPDGTFSRTVNNEPVRMKTGEAWEDISTDLVVSDQAGQRVLSPEMAPVGLTLGTTGSTTMATLDNRRGHSIKQTWPFGPLPEPRVDGDTATYPSVLPGVDLIQRVHKTGVSQVLRIATPEAAKDPRVVQMRILLDAENTTIQDNGVQGLSAVGKDTGKTELRTAEGLWWDSSQAGASAADPGGNGLARPFSLSLGMENGKQSQIFGMDEILNTPNLKYPLYVDPDWGVVRASYLFVDSAYPNTSYWNGQYSATTVNVGYLPPAWAPDGMAHTTRGYFQFSTSPMSGKVILAAKMNTTEIWSSSCTARPVDAWVTGGVSPSTTWNNQPGLVAKVDTQNVAKGYSASCPAGTVGFDMGSAKNIISTVGQWTVSLRASNEGDSLGWKRFQNEASMIVTYDTPPVTPYIWTISGAGWSGTPWASTFYTRLKQPTYTVGAHDNDGDAGGAINVWMTVFNSAGQAMFTTNTPIPVPGSGGLATWQGGTLPDGNYQLQAQSVDQQGQKSGVMQFYFTVDTTPPAPPKIVAPSFFDAAHHHGAGTVGLEEYAFTLNNDGPYSAKGFVYAVTGADTTPSFPGTVSCGTRTGEFVVVCPDGGRTIPITIGSVDERSRLTVWSFDYAGNVNQQVNSTPVSYDFTVGKLAADPTTVLQTSLQGGATAVDIEVMNHRPVPTGTCQGGLAPDSDALEIAKVLQFNGSGQYASTTEAAVDTSKSFSVSGWFCPSTPSGAGVQSLITQMAGTNSPGGAFRIGTNGSMELATWTGSNGTGLETVQRYPALAANSWSFVSGVYDKNNRQLRITVTTDSYTGTWTTATSAAGHLASPPTQPVLLGAAGAGGAGQFKGQILNPVMAPGILTPLQFNKAQSSFTDTLGVLK